MTSRLETSVDPCAAFALSLRAPRYNFIGRDISRVDKECVEMFNYLLDYSHSRRPCFPMIEVAAERYDLVLEAGVWAFLL